MSLRTAIAATVFILVSGIDAGAAGAGQKLAVFPFDLDVKPKEEDFYQGESKPSPEESARLKLVRTEFIDRLAADGRYEAVDLSGLATEIEAAQPLHKCNECDIDIAKKAGAELALTGIIDKVSETHLNMIISIRNVATGAQLRNMQVVIQGNTDETWLHGVRWLLKNRLLAEGASK